MRIDLEDVTLQTRRMKIHLNRGGQSLGQFSPEEVRAGLAEGKFLGSDLAWKDGMDSWKPLAECVDLVAPQSTDEMPELPVTLDQAGGLPWDDRQTVGFWSALFETIRLVLLEPTNAFSRMRPTGGFGSPLFYYVILGTIGGVAGILYQAVFNSYQQAATPDQQAVSAAMTSSLIVGATIMILPVFLAVGAYIGAGILHLSLMILGGAKRPFEATFRVCCFAGGSTAVLQLLPVCGGLAASVWNFVLIILGISKVHDISKGRAVVAVLLPTVVCCGLLLLAGFAIVAAAGGMAEVFSESLKAVE
jgi:hypothetical protein